MLGFTPDELPDDLGAWRARVHPADRDGLGLRGSELPADDLGVDAVRSGVRQDLEEPIQSRTFLAAQVLAP